MARYTGSVCKLCRNEGMKLFLKGERCDSPKCAISKRNYPSGQHGQARKKLSEYAIQLREKQKVRRSYGLSEKSFYRNFTESVKSKGVTGTVMFQRLESRFDSALYRSGLVPSRAQGRQLIRHGHFLVNGKRVDIPSYRLKTGDVISPRPRSIPMLQTLVESRKPEVPHWMDSDFAKLTVTFKGLPEREDIDQTIKEQLIIEYYKR